MNALQSLVRQMACVTGVGVEGHGKRRHFAELEGHEIVRPGIVDLCSSEIGAVKCKNS